MHVKTLSTVSILWGTAALQEDDDKPLVYLRLHATPQINKTLLETKYFTSTIYPPNTCYGRLPNKMDTQYMCCSILFISSKSEIFKSKLSATHTTFDSHQLKKWNGNLNDKTQGPWKEQTFIWTVYGMSFILWLKLIVKKSCNKESIAVATYCLAKYWWGTKSLTRITFKLPRGLSSQEILLWQSLLMFPGNKTVIF